MRVTTFAEAAPAENLDNCLSSTPCIDTGHSDIRALARSFTRLSDIRERAVQIHDFVRDNVRFGWTSRFYAMKASDVLHAGVGYCNTKSTLFIALLRASGIPARQRFVTIRADILVPFLSLPYRYVDHSYVEVWLGGVWVGVDSYIADPLLFAKAQRRLVASGRSLGYGVHADGTNEWDGGRDAFSQYVIAGRLDDLSSRDYGVFGDTQDFYASGERSEALVGLRRFLLPVVVRRCNQLVVRFRGADSQRRR